MNALTQTSPKNYNRFLLLVAGLGGLLYGVDVGIIAGALPYLEATSNLNAGQLSLIVAAVLLGSVISTLFAGMLADWLGRKPIMILSGVLFVVSIPVIALAQGFQPLVLGRLLQGISAGLIGVVVPLYLAECLSPTSRGRGTAIFQWMLTLGIVAAALIGVYFSNELADIEKTKIAEKIFAFKDMAWRRIFWVSLPPGILFVLGGFVVSESPRWLFRRGHKASALAALKLSQSVEQANLALAEMEETAVKPTTSGQPTGTIWQRKYVIPFVLACVILACNQATGINSLIGYNTSILLQAGLSDVQAHWGYVGLTLTNFLITMVGVALVDTKGRKFLLSLGTAGIIASLIYIGLTFRGAEQQRVDCKDKLQSLVAANELNFEFDAAKAAAFQDKAFSDPGAAQPMSLVVIYSYGDYRSATRVFRTGGAAAEAVKIDRSNSIPANQVISFFSKPFGDLKAAQTAPLKIENALLTPIPDAHHGWMVAIGLWAFIGFFAVGPGVCVWLALSELMPTRIRSNGMSIALLINQAVSTGIAATFLPTVGKYGYATLFFVFAGCTAVYFITAVFFLPETKGKTLEEIEEHFAGGKRRH